MGVQGAMGDREVFKEGAHFSFHNQSGKLVRYNARSWLLLQVHVFYKGNLAKNKKQFDSCLSGRPFSFRLGAGEVIRGWDLGVAGEFLF